MALQASGAISIGDIAGEFGGSTPHSLSEYYSAATGIPASGAIDISDFYGKSNIVVTLSTYTTISNYSNSTSTAGIRVGSDGYIYAKGNDGAPNSEVYTQINTGTDWIIPRSGMSSYYVYATQTGDTMGGTFTTDLSLGTDRTFTLSATQAETSKSSAITLVLKDSGLNTVATRLYNLAAERG
jgi:hypothetical protein